MVVVENERLTLKKMDHRHWEDVARLIHSDATVHRHLGWCPPLEWLGRQPYLGLYREADLIGVLACPPDEDSNTWLRLLGVAAGVNAARVWRHLWPAARAQLQERGDVRSVNALAMQNWMGGLLVDHDYRRTYQVVVMEWESSWGKLPPLENDHPIRPLEKGDLPAVYEIDKAAFEPIWRNSLKNLGHALDVAQLSSVAELDGQVVGYQISTADTLGGHLARLAVHPDYQKQRIGTTLLRHVLGEFERRGIVRVSVNTQRDNLASIKLYENFGFQRKGESFPVYQYFFNY